MSNHEKPDHKLVELTPMDMHGPIEVTIAVFVRLPDERVATLNFRQQAGAIPTRSEIKAVVDACLSENGLDGSSIPKGTRLLTKPEFVSHYTKKETGIAMTMPGDQNFVPASCDIPKDILVNAIFGAGGPSDPAMEPDYEQRGLGHRWRTAEGTEWNWNHDALTALPDDILLAIYRRCA